MSSTGGLTQGSPPGGNRWVSSNGVPQRGPPAGFPHRGSNPDGPPSASPTGRHARCVRQRVPAPRAPKRWFTPLVPHRVSPNWGPIDVGPKGDPLLGVYHGGSAKARPTPGGPQRVSTWGPAPGANIGVPPPGIPTRGLSPGVPHGGHPPAVLHGCQSPVVNK